MRYVFDPEVVHQCGLAGLGKPKPEMFDAVEVELERAFPGHVHRDQPWIYSIAGGVMIQMKVYFASLSEYLIIWGTPIGSEGHSGRHFMGFWDTVLDGECWYYAEGQFERTVFKPGDRIFVGRGEACGMNFTDGVWALEYARGPLPLSLPFGIADEILSTLDAATVGQTIGVYMDLLGRHWRNPEVPVPGWLRPLRRVAGIVPSAVGPLLTRLSRGRRADYKVPAAS